MSYCFKKPDQTFRNACLTIGTGSAIALASFITPQVTNAATIETFSVNGELNSSTVNNPIFSGADFTGIFNLNLDARYVSDIGTATYDLTSWNILLTAKNGDSFEFSQGESDDTAYMYLQPGFDHLGISGFNQLTINFTEDNSDMDIDEDAFLQIGFNTDHDITSSTTLTELLSADPKMGTHDAFRSGSVTNIMTDSRNTLKYASFTPGVEETVSPVPEASTLAMLGLGSLMVFGLARKNRKSPSTKNA